MTAPVRSRRRQRGQAAMEYILLLALVVGVFVGIFLPIIQKKTQGMQTTLRTRASSVLAQDQIGIPLQWFGLEGQADLDRLNAALGSNAGTGGPGSNANGGGPGADAKGKDGAGKNGNGGDNGSDNGRGGAGRNGRGSRNRSSGADDGGGGDSGSSSNASEQADSIRAGRRRGGGSGDSSFDGSSSGGRRAGGETGAAAGQDTNSKGGGEENGKKGPPKFANRENQSESGGCRGFDAFLLIKLVAIGGILILLGGMLFSGKGGKEGG